jgi:hypothetical protein
MAKQRQPRRTGGWTIKRLLREITKERWDQPAVPAGSRVVVQGRNGLRYAIEDVVKDGNGMVILLNASLEIKDEPEELDG